MSLTACAVLSATVLSLGVFQILGAPQDDPAYQLFALNIETQKDLVETKLNLSREIYVNNTKTFNLPEFNTINSTMWKCFEDVKDEYPSADPDCLDFISYDVQETIADSKNELDACTNLTHSWELIDQLLISAEQAISNLNALVGKILGKALNCVKRYPNNPTLKSNCFNTVSGIYNTQLNNATDLVQEAYYQISGGNLLLGAEASSCQKAENFSFTDKCSAIVSEVVSSCLITSTTPEEVSTTTA